MGGVARSSGVGGVVGPDGGAGTDPLAPYDGVLLLSYGGPDGPDDVLPFMRNATAGRGVPDSRLLEVSGHYQRFGGVSPINARNRELLAALRAELAARGSAVPVGWGNRNWHPFVAEGLAELLQAADGGPRVEGGARAGGTGRSARTGRTAAPDGGAGSGTEAVADGGAGSGTDAVLDGGTGLSQEAVPHRVLAITTSAYASYSGCRQYREDLARAVAELAGPAGSPGADTPAGSGAALTVDKTRPSYNTPGMLQANVDAVVEAYEHLAQRGVPAQDVRLVLVTHSVPVGMEEGSAPSDAERAAAPGAGGPGREPGVAADLSTEIGYVAQHEALAAVLVPEVAHRLGLAEVPDHDLVYCSRSGPPQARWLEPDVNDHLTALAAGEVRGRDGEPVARPGGVVVAPVGFVSDHMEVVFDLDTEAAQTAADLGLPYERAATAGTHPAFVTSLVDLLLERAAVARGEDVTPVSTTGTGPFHTVCPPTCCRPGTRPGHGAHQGAGRPTAERASRPTAAGSDPGPARPAGAGTGHDAPAPAGPHPDHHPHHP